MRIRTRTGQVLKGYPKADLSDAWSRYLPALPATSATSATDEANQRPNTSDVADVADLAAMGRATKPADDIPDFLLRQPDPNGGSGHRCDHCGALGATGRWDWPGRPDGIWLHPRCEAPWFDSEGRQRVQ